MASKAVLAAVLFVALVAVAGVTAASIMKEGGSNDDYANVTRSIV